MTRVKQFSVWDSAVTYGQKKAENEEDEGDQFARRMAGLKKCCCSCCPCSTPVLIGILIGTLVAGIALATILTIYLVDSGKKSNNSTTFGTSTSDTTITVTTATTTTATSASTTSATSSTSSTTSSTATTATTATTSTTTSTTTTAPYCTTRVTFDDIPGQLSTSGVVPNGYQNLNWTNVYYLNVSTMPTSGYERAVASVPYVAYSPTASTITIRSANTTRFAFNSITLAAAWQDNLEWDFFASRGGPPLFFGAVYLNVINKTRITCASCTNLDAIYFQTVAGTPHAGLAENGTQFAFDDLCISFGY